MRVLLVEDDERIAEYVANGLRQEGHVVEVAADGEAGLSDLTDGEYDAAIVDVMLPRRDGVSVVREARRRGVETPILMLSAKAEVPDRVSGLEAGADDYLTKPFSFAELSARLAALARRAARAPSSTRLSYADLELDLLTRRVRRAGREIELTAKELALLELFLRNPERVLSKTMILEHVWGYDFDPQTNVVDVLVHRLRKAVDHPFDRPLIQTVRGLGYVLRK